MSSNAAPRCQHIKVSGILCGSPALRKKSFCFYHQQNRPLTIECYSDGPYKVKKPAKTFRQGQSKPAIAPNRKRGIAKAASAEGNT